MVERDPIDDAAVVLRMAAGSEAALETLYDRYAGAIFAAAYRLTSDRGTAEEVVQETFLALWNRAETFDPGAGSLSAWLHTIARNRTIDRLRAAGRRPTLVALSSASGPDEDASQALDRLVERRLHRRWRDAVRRDRRMPSCARIFARRSARRLSTMPDVERTVILLAYQDDLSQVEIADRLGWPLGTVKTRTRRALARLRAGLGADYGPLNWDEAMPVPAGEDR